ncbi:Surfactin synthase thioesterase subunit [Oligella ureolytica]|uniref:thioesterase II family protein n=1 Tax=Oligella ureolytica TaxID=90244 RepID=UPI000DFA59B6|nr:alpha/beta fold hydrolase [Oligella ureolytica]SUA54413.1 Surfactin synthase thioesterase subunit [Oligella ureolytica]
MKAQSHKPMKTQSYKYCLYCLPSAGSSASMYFPWKQFSAKNLRIHAIEYPGHGSRIQEALLSSPVELIEDIANNIIKHHQPNEHIALFGHSLGGGLVPYIAEKLQSLKPELSICLLIISGRGAFATSNSIADAQQINNDASLLHFLEKYEGIPNALLNHQEALDFFLPIIRNDVLLNSSLLSFTTKPKSTDIPLLVFAGRQDKNTSNQNLEAWHICSHQWLGVFFFEGGHFYLNEPSNIHAILSLIKKHLGSYQPTSNEHSI